MLAGPIFRTELVSAARRRRYFVVRVVYGLILLVVLWSMYESFAAMRQYGGGQSSIRQSAQLASSFFLAFSWVQLIGVIALAPALAAGTISTERERRTIEYLFATDLSNLEIIAGKVLAKLLVVGKFMLVGVPILFLFRMLGGIPANVLGASFLISASTALVLTSLGVCLSVWSKRSKDATTRTYLVMLAFAIVPAILIAIGMMQFRQEPWWNDYAEPALLFFTGMNPVAVLAQSVGGMIGAGAGFNFQSVFEMVTAHGVIALVLLALATTSVRRVHLRELGRGDPIAKQKLGFGAWLPRWRPALGDRPMIWKESFAPTAKSKLGFVGGIAVALLGLVAVGSVLYALILSRLRYQASNDFFAFLMVYSGLVGSLALLLVAARASGLVTIEKERDCWTSLLSTPLTGGEIIRGKMLGNLYAARWPAAALVFAWLVGVIQSPGYLIVLVASLVTFAVCAWFVTMLGLWFSVRSSTSLRAQGLTLGTGIFVGGGYLFCCCTIFAGMGSRGDELMLGFSPCMPFLLALPSAAYLKDFFNSSGEQSLMVAFLAGVIGYAVVSGVLLAVMTSEFDSFAGRMGDAPQRPQREPSTST